jgi:glucose-6-phosphate-specific signal transduction histidine kinase
MRITIPRRLASSWDAFCRWGDVNVSRGIRRIDLLLVALGFVCVGYYWIIAGWEGALAGGLMYVMMAMIALWVL